MRLGRLAKVGGEITLSRICQKTLDAYSLCMNYLCPIHIRRQSIISISPVRIRLARRTKSLGESCCIAMRSELVGHRMGGLAQLGSTEICEFSPSRIGTGVSQPFGPCSAIQAFRTRGLLLRKLFHIANLYMMCDILFNRASILD